MMKNVHCETCCYWSPSQPRETGTSYGFQSSGAPNLGQCRRFPPFMVRTEKGQRANWPITIDTHWCGEHGEIVKAQPEE